MNDDGVVFWLTPVATILAGNVLILEDIFEDSLILAESICCLLDSHQHNEAEFLSS